MILTWIITVFAGNGDNGIMKKIPPVSRYMTTFPILIDASAPLREAIGLMSANRFRHLPVVRDGEPVGILSDRDLKLASGLNGIDLERTTVEDIVRPGLFTVSPDALIDEVAQQMSIRRIGSAVVVQNSKIVGIFTTTDALHALCGELRRSA